MGGDIMSYTSSNLVFEDSQIYYEDDDIRLEVVIGGDQLIKVMAFIISAAEVA